MQVNDRDKCLHGTFALQKRTLKPEGNVANVLIQIQLVRLPQRGLDQNDRRAIFARSSQPPATSQVAERLGLSSVGLWFKDIDP